MPLYIVNNNLIYLLIIYLIISIEISFNVVILFYFCMEELYTYKEKKTLQKRQSRKIKYNNATTTKKIIYYVQL